MKRQVLKRISIISLVGALTTLMPLLASGDGRLRVQGSGATLPAPLYLGWARAYLRDNPDIQVDYQGIGSAGGLRDLEAGRVAFAGADFLLPADRAAALAGGITQLPMAAAGVAIIYNLDGTDDLKLSRAALTGIFDGSIADWNDPAITKTNPDAELPDARISLVVRVGASGTCYNLTRHMSSISPTFAEAVGAELKPVWPKAITERGALIKARGNDGIAAMVQAVSGSIGYVSYPFAYYGQIPMASIENQSGAFVAPSAESFAAAMDAIKAENENFDRALVADDVTEPLAAVIDPPGEASYPIIAISWLSMPKTAKDAAVRKALLGYIDYALGPGQEIVPRVGYIPFSDAGIALIKRAVDELR